MIRNKKGYTGGAVDVYKPYGENIYRYDVNSLYPYVMREFPMPVGNITYFDGNTTEINPKPFGILEVEVTSPSDLKIPILQTRIKTKSGTKTIAPLGSWTGWYFSEEIYNAMKYGYKFKILRGYLFEKGFIFREYVDDLYNMKRNSNKGSASYTISKLLLNSLYGKFGMSPLRDNLDIINIKDLSKYTQDYIITDIVNFNNEQALISYHQSSIDETKVYKDKSYLNINVAIASAVTSYARIYMYNTLYNSGLTPYYMDTDCFHFNDKLPDDLVSNSALGEFKLENVFKEIIYLSPKVYIGITKDNNKIVKAKGFKDKDSLTFNNLKSLLYQGNKLDLHHTKFYKNYPEGFITSKNEIYTLISTYNKRKPIYNDKGFLQQLYFI